MIRFFQNKTYQRQYFTASFIMVYLFHRMMYIQKSGYLRKIALCKIAACSRIEMEIGFIYTRILHKPKTAMIPKNVDPHCSELKSTVKKIANSICKNTNVGDIWYYSFYYLFLGIMLSRGQNQMIKRPGHFLYPNRYRFLSSSEFLIDDLLLFG